VTPIPEVWNMLLKSAGMLCVVIGILLLMVYIIKRFSLAGGGKRGQTSIKVLSSIHFGAKEKVALIDVLGKKILLGITANNINFLTEFDKDIDVGDDVLNKEKGIFSFMLKKNVQEVDKTVKEAG